ncbi:MAG: Archaetidylinositol phosphate synthase [Candidatus Bathyarchaeota archaeon BA1]|nr:MAG: Archaetidylinositol phosphate synthase [Candidatus Bathyarchaeota archaeon BA1]
MITKLKEKFQCWITSEARMAHDIGFTPNQVSTVGIMLAIFSALAYLNWRSHPILLMVAPIFLLASGFCDVLDGALARIYETTTTFGGYLDSLLDRYTDSIIFCSIMLGGLCDPLWGLMALIGSLLVSYARARAEAVEVKMEGVGIAERAERLIILAMASFLSVAWSEALGWGIIVLAILTNLTVLQRMNHFRKVSRQKRE